MRRRRKLVQRARSIEINRTPQRSTGYSTVPEESTLTRVSVVSASWLIFHVFTAIFT